MNFDLDFLKAFRETFDWGEEKGKSIIRFKNKSKLNKIINALSDLIAHKKVYLYNIQLAIDKKDQAEIDSAISKSLIVAEEDTLRLINIIEKTDLRDSGVYKVLKTKADVLANNKLKEIDKVKQAISSNAPELDIGVSELLSGFESRWDEISNELEEIKQAAANAK